MIGQKLGSYRIEAELGSGAMGVVYRGLNEAKNKPAAVKVISMEHMNRGGTAAKRFEREADILEQFRHPNIVRYLARGRSGGVFYYAMEFIKGPTLDQLLGERGTIPWQEVAALGVQLCDALQHAHSKGVVHRDLKPSNLMIAESGQLKLTDFGIGKDLDAESLTGTGRTLGTATYMAPEQIRGTPAVSHKTDLYALGAVFYHLLTGVPPFIGTTAIVMMHAHINEPAKRPSDKIEEIPKALDDLVISLMAKEPKDRPWDAQAVAEVLRGLLDKAARQETIKMAWPVRDSIAAMPSRAEMIDPTAVPRKKPKGSRKKAGRKALKARVEVLGLVAALAVVAGLIGYIVWPPGAAYLVRQAETLMASPEPTDWLLARERYIIPLYERFPQHPYREKTEPWLDKIDLRDAERRAEVLQQVNLTGFSKPKTEAEDYYQNMYKEVDAALKRHDDREAARLWRSLEKSLAREGRENRGWILLVRGKADALDKVIQRRRQTVEGLMAQAAIPAQLADNELARTRSRKILEDVVKRFGDYPDVADYIDQARAVLASFENPAMPPDPGAVPKS